MNISRYELMPGVWVTHAARKGDSACLSFNILAQTDRDTAAVNALLPYVLRCGTANDTSYDALSAKLASIGASAKPTVRRVGEIQCLGMVMTLPAANTAAAAELLGRILLSPATRGGLLLPGNVEAEREKMAERLAATEEYSPDYALRRCLEHTCCYEDYCISPLGDEDSVRGVHYQKLTKQYRVLLQSAPVEIFYCGDQSVNAVRMALKDAFMTFPRGEVDYELGTDVRMNAVEEEPRRIDEELAGAEKECLLAFRLGECMMDPDPAALTVFAGLFEGTRLMDIHKGLWVVACENEDDVLAGLRAISEGRLEVEKLEKARAAAADALRACMDDVEAIEDFSLGQTVDGYDFGPDELAALCEDVDSSDMAEIAKSVECDVIYTLAPEGE